MARDFVARAPNRTWVADFTHVAAWAGDVYVVDTFSRRIVGSSASVSKETRDLYNHLIDNRLHTVFPLEENIA